MYKCVLINSDDFLLFQWNLDIPKLFHNDFVGTDSIPICVTIIIFMCVNKMRCIVFITEIGKQIYSVELTYRVLNTREINNSKTGIVSNNNNHSGRKDDVIKEHDHF